MTSCLRMPITFLSCFFPSLLSPQNFIAHLLTSDLPVTSIHLVSHRSTSWFILLAFTDPCLIKDALHLIPQILSSTPLPFLPQEQTLSASPLSSLASALLGPPLLITGLPSPWCSPKSPAPTRSAPGGRRPNPRPRGPAPPAPAARSHG